MVYVGNNRRSARISVRIKNGWPPLYLAIVLQHIYPPVSNSCQLRIWVRVEIGYSSKTAMG
jgi:hypothetical protein